MARLPRLIRIPRPGTLVRKMLRTKSGPPPILVFVLLISAFLILSLQNPDTNSPVQIISGSQANTYASHDTINCTNPSITDGDTFKCNGVRIRLQGIDAPEMAGHCRVGRKCVEGNPDAARDYLHEVSRGSVTCEAVNTDKYGRTVARCNAHGVDLSCAMIKSEHAVRRYAHIDCDDI
jgi:endonuclease YncB( thermonuclease family)